MEALRTDLMSPGQLKTEAVNLRTQAQANLQRDAERIRTLSLEEHAAQLAQAREELAEAKQQRQESKEFLPAISADDNFSSEAARPAHLGA